MSRLFSTVSALGRSAVQWLNKEKLPTDYQKAAEKYIANGAVRAGLLPFETPDNIADPLLESWRDRESRDPVSLALYRSPEVERSNHTQTPQ